MRGVQDRLRERLPALTSMPVPTYVLHGSADPIVPVAASAVRAGLSRKIVAVALPDEFLAAGALPTLHEHYGLSKSRLVGTILEHLG